MADKLPDAIEWEAFEYLHFDRSNDWFWTVGLVAVILAVVAILFGNVLFAVLVAIAAFTLTLQALRAPGVQYYALTPRGVIEGDTLYPYSTLDSFWVADEHEHNPKLLIKSRKTLMPLISIPLGGADPEMIHNYLVQFIDDELHNESFAQHLMEFLGF